LDGNAPDIELMLRFQKGEEAAFDALVKRHQRSILNLVRRFLGPNADAEDLAQEVFVRLYQARKNYRPSARFTTYLYRNTLNLCLNYIRNQKHRKTHSLDAPRGEGDYRAGLRDERGRDPGDGASTREREAIVRDAVSALPENQRQALILSRWHGLSYQEIADTLDMSIMAVKSVLWRARENLRETLSVHLKDEDIVKGAEERGEGEGIA